MEGWEGTGDGAFRGGHRRVTPKARRLGWARKEDEILPSYVGIIISHHKDTIYIIYVIILLNNIL